MTNANSKGGPDDRLEAERRAQPFMIDGFGAVSDHGTAEDMMVPRDLEPIGVIDIGSNSVRLVVYEGAVRAPAPLFNEKVLCGLGRSVATTGRLGDDGVARALSALTRFGAIARTLGVKNLWALATAAVRDAADGPAFIARGEAACGCRIQILSGEREAELAAMGIHMGFTKPDGIAADLGGGSLELIDIVGSGLRNAITLPLGGLRLIDTSDNKLERAIETVDAEIARVEWLQSGRGRTFYAVGGTWRALAKLHMVANNYPLRVMHGYQVPARELADFCEDVRKGRKVEGLKEISKARREVLPYGALTLERVLKKMEPKAVVFSVFGIREGLLYSLLSEHERSKDPLLGFCEEYARLRSRSVAHAYELCNWTDALFVDGGLKETPEERRLRHAACLLSDIGWRAHPDYRGEQSLNVVAHAALAGVDHPGRLFLALTIYFRHVGDDDEGGEHLSDRMRRAIDKRAMRRARLVGAAIRAAHMLSIGRAGVIDDTRLRIEKDKLVLELPRAHAALDGERFRRRFEALAGLTDRKADIRIVG
jgi:exopolyphosphatase / guanosine-5'-triphosphate,3'-diphosphate pyrophosphatase